MSAQFLQAELETLQCHFTWCLLDNEELGTAYILQTLASKAQHTAYRNRGVYLTMKAYVQQLEGNSTEALGSLREAETVLWQDHPTSFQRQVLVTYGNYAWVYYHLANFDMVELYLGRVCETCQSLSRPEPNSVQIPEIHAQKGWSLLAVGFQKGEEAKECFQMALEGDQSNTDYRAGLAISLFAMWTHSQSDDHWEEAKRLMELYYCGHPLNNEVKVHLASLVQKTDWQRAKRLVEEAVQSSLDPEVLRNAAEVCKPHSLPRAIEILKEAIALAPHHHLLHYDLGTCCSIQSEEAADPEESEEVLATALESFKRAVEMNPRAMSPRLELARMYSKRDPHHAKEAFWNLQKRMPSFSQRGQQIFCLYYGDFLSQQGLRKEAAEVYGRGFTLPGGSHNKEGQRLRGRLEALATLSQGDSERH